MSPPAADVGDSDEETKALVYRYLLSVSRELADQFKHEFSLDEKKGPTNVLNLEEIVEVSQLLAETMALNTLIYHHLLSSRGEYSSLLDHSGDLMKIGWRGDFGSIWRGDFGRVFFWTF